MNKPKTNKPENSDLAVQMLVQANTIALHWLRHVAIKGWTEERREELPSVIEGLREANLGKQYRRAEILVNILSAVRMYLRTRKDWELDFIRRQIEEYDALLERKAAIALCQEKDNE